MKTLPAVNHPSVRRIVGACHVGESPRCVVRKVLKSLKAPKGKRKQGKKKGWRLLDKIHRRYAIAAAIQAHAENIWEYRYVMGSVPRSYPKFKPRYFWDADNLKVIIKK